MGYSVDLQGTSLCSSSTRSEAAADRRGRWIVAVGLRLPASSGRVLYDGPDGDTDAAS